MPDEEFSHTVSEAFQKGKKDPYSGLRKRITEEGAKLWLDTLNKQKAGEIPPNRYGPDPKKVK
ncbi:hypothetical protein M1271_03160 [Patescibacteria group bacterium]|nr:hypothetical protein [Patescibacteria group bacterium]MCL5797325.1 hypothetical protein [Patescibacteria group bacterium]